MTAATSGAPRPHRDQGRRSAYENADGLPKPAQRRVDRLPLLALFGELRLPASREVVILAAPPAVGRFPARLDMAQPLQAMQHRIEHAVGPFDASLGKIAHPLQD